MKRPGRPASWWEWAFRFAAAADRARELGSKPYARYLADAADHAINAAHGWPSAFTRKPPSTDPADVLARQLTRRDIPEAQAGPALEALRQRGWASVRDGKARLTRAGREAMARAGFAMAHRPSKPGPTRKLADDEIQDDD